MRFGVPLGLVHPSLWFELAVAADELGFESVWMPEHLVFGHDLATDTYPGGADPGIKPSTPLFDAPAYLCALAAVTRRVRLGTAVYLLGLRHPFMSARAFATLDHISGGRAIVGVGAGWYSGEWQAVGLDFATRGRRLDEAIDVVRRLWTEEAVEHHGEFYSFDPVAFEPRPRRPLPLLAGGESPAALRRAARCDGWISMPHTLSSIRPQLDRLRRYGGCAVTAHAYELTGPREVRAWADLGVERLIVRPWRRGREAVEGLRRFAEEYGVAAGG